MTVVFRYWPQQDLHLKKISKSWLTLKKKLSILEQYDNLVNVCQRNKAKQTAIDNEWKY